MTRVLEMVGMALKGLARRQAYFGEVTLDPPFTEFSDLVFCGGCEQPSNRPQQAQVTSLARLRGPIQSDDYAEL